MAIRRLNKLRLPINHQYYYLYWGYFYYSFWSYNLFKQGGTLGKINGCGIVQTIRMWTTGFGQGLYGCGCPYHVDIMKNVPSTPIKNAFHTVFSKKGDFQETKILNWVWTVCWMCVDGMVTITESWNLWLNVYISGIRTRKRCTA